MSLRDRLVVVLLGSGLVLVAALAIAREFIVGRARDGELRRVLEARVDAIGRERCEQGWTPRPDGPEGPRAFLGGAPPPLRMPGGRRGAPVFFFGRDFSPEAPGSPPIPPEARDRLGRGETFMALPTAGESKGLMGVLATGWGADHCAYALAFWPLPPPPLPTAVTAVGTVFFLGALAGALYLATGSPVRRIRALAEGVRASAARHYEGGVRVEGGDEIAALAEAFNAAASTVRRQLKAVENREGALRDFVAHATHDVGVPLSVLAGALAEAREASAKGGSIDAPLSTAVREAHYIGALLHNLGAVSRLDTEDFPSAFSPVDLVALVERVVLRHALLARDAGVELNHGLPDSPVRVRGDVTLLEQAVNNLVHNAVRYNQSGGHVAVVLDEANDRFLLRVTDDGNGLSDAEIARLGESRFRGGDARSRRPEGSGLGLAIARDVAVRHGFELAFRRPDTRGVEAALSGPVMRP